MTRLEGGNSESERRKAKETEQLRLEEARCQAIGTLLNLNIDNGVRAMRAKEFGEVSISSEEATRAAITLATALRRALKGKDEAMYSNKQYTVFIAKSSPAADNQRAITPWKEPSLYDMQKAKKADPEQPAESTRPCRSLGSIKITNATPVRDEVFIARFHYDIKDTFDDTGQVNTHHDHYFSSKQEKMISNSWENPIGVERITSLTETQEVARVLRILFETEI